jgi:hypothetical protein
MSLKTMLDNYLGKPVRFSEQDNGDGSKERAGHQHLANRRVKVETARGIKQLLNG